MEISKKLEESKITNILDFANMSLKNLPEIPDNIKKLYVYNNQLTFLPKLPENLEELYCGNNQIEILPTLPNSLVVIYCESNNINALPSLPKNLKILFCENNKLVSLPKLPPNLNLLYCVNNNIISLPELPKHLKVLVCNKNKLTFIPIIPDTIAVLLIDDNPYDSLFKNLIINKSQKEIIYNVNKYYINKEYKKLACDVFALNNTINRNNLLCEDVVTFIGYCLSGINSTIPIQIATIKNIVLD